jgi:hypothetical protein
MFGTATQTRISSAHAAIVSAVLCACAGDLSDPTPGAPPPPSAGAPVAGQSAPPSGTAGAQPVTMQDPPPVVTTPPPAGSAAPVVTPAAGSAAPPTVAGGVTYHRDIRPLIEARCVGCHIKGGPAPFYLDTWPEVDMYKSAIVGAVQARRMPPWTADDTNCNKLRDSQRLSDAQLKLFADWQAGGFAAGNEADFTPLVEAPKPVLGEPTIIVKPTAYQLRANDEHYQCLQTDANIAEDTWVTALDVVPQHSEYVHHAIVSVGNGSCSALGTTAENIYSYRPGSRTVVFEQGDALLLKGGSSIAIEFHYNTKFAPAGMTLPTDQSPLRLWTLPKGQKPQRAVVRVPHHISNLSIPVNAVDQVYNQTMRLGAEYTQPGAEIIGMSPHMHYLGQKFNETLNTSDGKSVCLVDIPDWDQAWQLDYMFDPSAYIKISSGASVSQKCVFSNRLQDQGVGPDGVQFTPAHTTFGEDTRQEMCLGYVWIRYPMGGAQ